MFPTLSFGEQEASPDIVRSRTAKVAGGLAAAGIKVGDTIAIMMRNEPALIEVMLAARQLGVYYTPLNWHFKAEEVAYIIRDCGAKYLIIHSDLLQSVAVGIPPGVAVFPVRPHPLTVSAYRLTEDALQVPAGTPDWEEIVELSKPLTTSAATPSWSIPYTSGTTGQPKGVRRLPPSPEVGPTQAERLKTMYHLAFGITTDARCMISAPLYHSAPLSFALATAMFGAWLRIEPKFDAKATLAAIERWQITHPYLVPTMYVRLLRLPPEVRSGYDLSSVQFVSSTGAPCAPDIKQSMIDWWGKVINETYAASETGYLTLISSDEAEQRPGSAGRPLEGVSIKILDDEGQIVPAGVVGKIYARQHAMPQFTYINREEDRKAIELDGHVTIGDIGYLDQAGYLYISDRRTDLILSGGVNIYPAEIEKTLITMPGVADCAVFGMPDEEFGQSLVAAVQTEPGVSLTAQQVQKFLSTRLANFKIPKVINFRTSLPREDTGKIFKRKLMEEYKFQV